MGWEYPPLYGKDDERDAKQIGKLEKRIIKHQKAIESLEADKAIYQERIDKRHAQKKIQSFKT